MSVVPRYDRRRRVQQNDLTRADRLSNQSAESLAFSRRPCAPVYQFFCQLAHGSPTGIISGFRTVRELHTKIAQCYDLNFSDIMYCTLNTHKLDVNKVLGYEIGLNDFIFAHIRGQPKEITMCKQYDSLGMTLTDTGCGTVFIKRIQPGGTIAQVSERSGGLLEVGDQIERINEVSFVGRRHYEVAAYLKRIPVGSDFLLRVVSPERSPIYMLNPRGRGGANTNNTRNGKRTIRFHGNGVVEERTVLDTETEILRRINQTLGDNLGFEDDELACILYIIANEASTPQKMMLAMNHDQVRMYYIPPDVIYQIWTVVHFPQRYAPMNTNYNQYEDDPTLRDNYYIPATRFKRRM